MIKPETSDQLLARIHNGSTVTLTRTANRDGWFQQVRDKQGELVYFKDVSICTATGNIEVFEEWWDHNEAGQVIYNKDSDGLECWHAYDRDGKDCGYRDNRGKASGIYAIEDERAADGACRGREREPLVRTVEQRLEDIESSLDHMSDQMKLIIKVMSVEYKLGDYE